jgi:hypothetical protein
VTEIPNPKESPNSNNQRNAPRFFAFWDLEFENSLQFGFGVWDFRRKTAVMVER